MINVNLDPSTIKPKNFIRILYLARATSQTIRINTPSGSYYLQDSRRMAHQRGQLQMMTHRYHRARNLPPMC